LDSDFSVRLTGDYYLIQTSPDLTEVVNTKVGREGAVPAKVIQIAWNNNVILAKQQDLENRRMFPGDRVKVPAPGKFEWWIIDTRTRTRYGPMYEAEFLTKVKALGEENLKLQNVSDLKGKESAQ
jgi:hypothetical protein